MQVAAWILSGALLMTVSSYLVIPMVPVPITMQTLAVTTIGAFCGPRLGFATILFWLVLGAVGLPVFAGGGGGVEHLTGPTAGYLIAFPFAAAMTGYLVANGWDAQKFGLACAAMLVGNFVCLSGGAIWLATKIGFAAALTKGFMPFLIGAAIKSAMGALILILAAKLSFITERSQGVQS